MERTTDSDFNRKQKMPKGRPLLKSSLRKLNVGYIPLPLENLNGIHGSSVDSLRLSTGWR